MVLSPSNKMNYRNLSHKNFNEKINNMNENFPYKILINLCYFNC